MERVFKLSELKEISTTPRRKSGLWQRLHESLCPAICKAADAAHSIGFFLGGVVNAHRDNEVHSVLRPVTQLEEKLGRTFEVVARIATT